MILLDTHAWVWWVTESARLSAPARAAMEKEDTLGVSVMSCWEVAMLVDKGRLGLTLDVDRWVEQALARPRIRLLGLTPEEAVASTRLPGELHQDPVDRILAATCLHRGLPLVTRDDRLQTWGHLRFIW